MVTADEVRLMIKTETRLYGGTVDGQEQFR